MASLASRSRLPAAGCFSSSATGYQAIRIVVVVVVIVVFLVLHALPRPRGPFRYRRLSPGELAARLLESGMAGGSAQEMLPPRHRPARGRLRTGFHQVRWCRFFSRPPPLRFSHAAPLNSLACRRLPSRASRLAALCWFAVFWVGRIWRTVQLLRSPSRVGGGNSGSRLGPTARFCSVSGAPPEGGRHRRCRSSGRVRHQTGRRGWWRPLAQARRHASKFGDLVLVTHGRP